MSLEPELEIRKMSRRSFAWAGIAALAGFGSIRWLATRREEAGVGWAFRRTLETNEGLVRDIFYQHKLVPTFTEKDITPERINGTDGLSGEFDPAMWKLRIEGVHQKDGPIELTLDELKAMPKTEIISQFCCIEGWSVIQKWAGVRLIDLMAKYPPSQVSGDAPDPVNAPEKLVPYVAMLTPDEGYYVGLDMESATHPQTLLAYELDGKSLLGDDGQLRENDHGAPLRLIIPVKYGVKNIKRIGTIRYTSDRPKDFWAEQGYDWFAGL